MGNRVDWMRRWMRVELRCEDEKVGDVVGTGA